MMKRYVIGAACLVCIAGVAFIIRGQVSQGFATIRPELTAVLPKQSDGSLRVPIHTTVQFQLKIAAPAFIYLFDELDDVATLVWPHIGPAWEVGTYETQSAVLSKRGIHNIVVIASPKAHRTWPGRKTTRMLAACEKCELTSLKIQVYEKNKEM